MRASGLAGRYQDRTVHQTGKRSLNKLPWRGYPGRCTKSGFNIRGMPFAMRKCIDRRSNFPFLLHIDETGHMKRLTSLFRQQYDKALNATYTSYLHGGEISFQARIINLSIRAIWDCCQSADKVCGKNPEPYWYMEPWQRYSLIWD